MAHIDFRDNLFYGMGTYEERHLWKEAGFTFSKLRRAWVTDRLDIAKKVTGVYWRERALDHVQHTLEVAKISEEMSWKATTDYVPPSPPGLEYLPYQRAGIEYALMRKDTLIADQPGLGKTIQAIGVLNADTSINSAIFIVPASLKVNWKREIDKWMVPNLTFGIAEASRVERVQDGFTKAYEKVEDGVYKSGPKAGQPKFKKVEVQGKPKYRVAEVQKDYWPNTDIVIINYDILDRFTNQIKSRTWDYVVCDECHALKTDQSGRTLFVLGGQKTYTKQQKKERAAKGLSTESVWHTAIDANRRVFLSGTPMMSRPVELWPIVKAFDPNGLGTKYLDYVYKYCGAYHDPMRGKNGALVTNGATNLVELGEKMRSSFMVRRLKREVLPELPPKRRVVVPMDSPEIRALVAREDELAQMLKLYEKVHLGQGEVIDEIVHGAQIIDNAARIGFSADMDPDHPNWRTLDLDYAAAVAGLEPPAVSILFEEMAAVRRELGIAKLSCVTPWVSDFLEGGEKLLLFAYHSDVVKAIAERMDNWCPAVIWGGTPMHKRQAQVDRFQTDESCRLFIGNIAAAGVGFTLTRAADVAFAEGDWVPSMIEQCEDRACRIGQTAEKIMSYFLVANGSLDARIAQAAKEKEDNINQAMGA
ncbi:superfamily II DNA/RNA helicase [Caulobacter phage CcrPW]|uniref:Superfamily II DNA/RNA helicase n=1 Tax=Caulobacter phage CcrPW TaxID=2283271 RepID=A0A385ECX4_9CAUD|nr:superfamily II DNA/RNA helicase [Caulobacter phage CcrPW]AXQ68712.1 superfamily II DNA/RNA helicase [Caulobacter phage CcrPW]